MVEGDRMKGRMRQFDEGRSRHSRISRHFRCAGALAVLAAALCLGAGPCGAEPVASRTEAVELARAFLAEEDPARRATMLGRLEGWSEDLDGIAAELRPAPPAGVPTGYLPEDPFTLPHLRERMARLGPREEGPVLPPEEDRFQPEPGEEHLNWVHVPESYDPERPLGLVINLHGGAGDSRQSAAATYLESQAFVMMDLLRGEDFITVCAGTPPIRPSKWSYPESETHIEAIIEEYSTRYAVDPDRVYLMGSSMGGIGCWWHAFRHSDRFALIAPKVGTWRTAYWPRLRGTRLVLISGAYDHHTHVDFHRLAHRRMDELGLDHFDAEYPGAHSRALGRPQIEALFELIALTRRDPYAVRVCAAAPFAVVSDWNSEEELSRYPERPWSFWAGVLETGDGGLPVDVPERDERGVLGLETRLMPGAGSVDAENLGGNRFRVRTVNVERFALWLHPAMGIDFSEPVAVEWIDCGVEEEGFAEVERARRVVERRAAPSLAEMLRVLDARGDHGLIYHAVVEVGAGGD